MTGRVWERFLTPEDRMHLAASRHRTVNFGQRPALLLIDLYRSVFGDEPLPLLEGIKTWPGYCGMAAWDAIPAIQQVLGRAREVGIPVLHVTGLDGAGMPGWGEAAKRDWAQPPSTDPKVLERMRRRYEIIDELAPIPGEVVLRKSAPSAFWGTPLAGQLTYLGVDTLIVCGESTSGCVRASVVEGCTHRYRMMVVEEGVFDRHYTAHAMNLFDMHQKYADVITVKDALGYLEQLPALSMPLDRVPVLAGV